MASKRNEKDIRGAKGDSAKQQRIVEALRANLAKRKARARAVASENKARARAVASSNEAQARGRKTGEGG